MSRPALLAPALLAPVLLALSLLAACSEKPQSAQSAEPPRVAKTAAQLAYSYTYQFRLPSDQVADIQRRHIAMCTALGLRCRLLETHGGVGSGRTSGSTKLEVASAIAQQFGDTLADPVRAAGGTLKSNDIAAEDLSRQIVDSTARVHAKEVLVARLTRMLETRAGSTADLVATEKAVAEVQEQLDVARTALAQAQGRIATSPIDIGYEGARTFGAETGTAIGAIGETLASSVAALIYALTAAVPWLAVFAGLFFGTRALLRRTRRRA